MAENCTACGRPIGIPGVEPRAAHCLRTGGEECMLHRIETLTARAETAEERVKALEKVVEASKAWLDWHKTRRCEQSMAEFHLRKALAALDDATPPAPTPPPAPEEPPDAR